MGVNLTKEVKEAIEKSKQNAEEAAEAAANAPPEPEKTDCDTVKKKNASKLTQVFQNFVDENKGNLPAVLKTIGEP